MPQSKRDKVKNKRILTAIEWLVTIAAYGYLGYRLLTYGHYDRLSDLFGMSGIKEWLCLALCLLLMPVNFFLESAKWKELLLYMHPLSRKEALHQVLYGQMAAFVTPYRIGDIPARTSKLKDTHHWKSAIALGMYGGIIQTFVIIACGIIPVFFFFRHTTPEYLLTVTSCLVIALILMAVMQKKSLPQSIRLTGRQFALTLVWSSLRYLCWLIQFVLIMSWAGVMLQPVDLFVALPAYYLFVTVTPNIPVADAGIRGSWAVFTFGSFGVSAPVAALIALSMWAINTLLPVALYLPLRSCIRQ